MPRTLTRYRTLLIAFLHPQRGKAALLSVLLLDGIGLRLVQPVTPEKNGSEHA